MIPKSDAYSDLCQTNIKSYAIAGIWKSNTKDSHESQESYYKTIADKEDFNLDDTLDVDDDDNDLVVSATSQLGGLPKQILQPNSNNIPNHSALYCNTVHDTFYIKDEHIFSETNSPHIQNDVIKLLSSSDNNKFANAIGIGSLRSTSKYRIRIRF